MLRICKKWWVSHAPFVDPTSVGNQKVWLQKTFVLHRWISMDCSKKNCWLNHGLQIYIFFVLSYNHLYRKWECCIPFFLTHSNISKHPAFQSQVLWILPRPQFGNFSWSFWEAQNPRKPTEFQTPGLAVQLMLLPTPAQVTTWQPGI